MEVYKQLLRFIPNRQLIKGFLQISQSSIWPKMSGYIYHRSLILPTPNLWNWYCMDEDIIAYLILYKFPPQLDHLKTTITHSLGKLKIDGNLVLQHLNQIKNKIATTSQASAFSVKSGSNLVSIRCKPNRQNPQASHPKNTCYWLFPHLCHNLSDQSNPQAATSSNNKSNPSTHLSYAFGITMFPIVDRNKILLDSGASNSMFNNPNFFFPNQTWKNQNHLLNTLVPEQLSSNSLSPPSH